VKTASDTGDETGTTRSTLFLRPTVVEPVDPVPDELVLFVVGPEGDELVVEEEEDAGDAFDRMVVKGKEEGEKEDVVPVPRFKIPVAKPKRNQTDQP
jgi:hypothetical protein